MTAMSGRDATREQGLEEFRLRFEGVVRNHPVVVANPYTRWFAEGEATHAEVRHLTVQFSVFSHQFIEAQLRKVMNAADLESYRAGKEILMNELGVVFRPTSGRTSHQAEGRRSHGTEIEAGEARDEGKPEAAGDRSSGAMRRGHALHGTRGILDAARVGPSRAAEGGIIDPDIVGTTGTVEGGRFRFAAAHFEWLLKFGDGLGLKFEDLGKRRHGTPRTLFFFDELLRLYGSEDPSVAVGASFAVEHWAAAGFWKELIAGLSAFKSRHGADLPLGFWTWHDRLEEQHAAHTSDELDAALATPGFDREVLLLGAREMLHAVKIFWDGLWRDHLEREARRSPDEAS